MSVRGEHDSVHAKAGGLACMLLIPLGIILQNVLTYWPDSSRVGNATELTSQLSITSFQTIAARHHVC